MSASFENGLLIDFDSFVEERGILTVLDLVDDIPFKADCVRWVDGIGLSEYESNDGCQLILIALRGCLYLKLYSSKENIKCRLSNPTQGVCISGVMAVEDVSDDFLGLIISAGSTKVGMVDGEALVQNKSSQKYTVDDCCELNVDSCSVCVDGSFPFNIRRVFYVYGIPGETVRGMHSHNSYHEALFSIKGSYDVEIDDGGQKKIFTLSDSAKGLYLPPTIWASQKNFSEEVCCLVFASGEYSREGYIDSYDEYLRYRGYED